VNKCEYRCDKDDADDDDDDDDIGADKEYG
jgi:hypothetical protein